MADKLIVTRRVGAVNVITTGDRTVVSRDRRQVVSVGTRGPAGPAGAAGAAGPAGPAGAAGYPTPVSPGVPLVGKTDGSGVEFTSSILGGLAFYSQLRNALSSTFQIDDDGSEYYTSIVTETGIYAITINQDKVGVNTAVVSPTPAARLHVYDDFGTQLRLQGYTQSTDFQTLAGGLFVTTSGASIRHLVDGGTVAQFISAGGIGVGTTIPLARHDIRTGSASTVGQIVRGAVGQSADLQRWQNSTGTTLARVDSTGSVSGNILNATSYIIGRGTITTESTPGGTGSVVVAASDSGPNRIDTYNYIDLGLGDGPNQYSASLYLTCDGFSVPFLGWGNSTPAAPIDIVRADTQIKLAYSAGGSYDCTVNGDLSGLTLNAFSGGAIRLQTAGTNRLFANASGVGLGTASPSARLDVRTGATTTIGQVIRAATSQTADLQQWQNSSGTANAFLGADFSLKLNATTSSWKPSLWVSDNNGTLGGMMFFEYRGGAANNKIHGIAADGNGIGFYRVTDAGTAFVRSPSVPDLVISPTGLVGLGIASPTATLDVRAVSSSTIGQVVRGASSQSSNLTEWQDSAGTVLAKVDKDGAGTFTTGTTIAGVLHTTASSPYVWQEFASGKRWGVRQSGGSGGIWCYGAGEGGVTAALALQPTATTNNGLWVRGLSSQTADLTQWQDSTGTVVAAVTSDGRIGVGTAPTSNSTLHIKMPGAKQGFVVTNGDSTGTQTWFGFTTGNGPLGTGNDEYVNFYKDANGWIWNSDKGGTGTARAVRWTHAGTERMKINGTGIGFLGATPAAQQTGGSATAGGTYGATEQGMLQKAYDALRTFGLLS